MDVRIKTKSKNLQLLFKKFYRFKNFNDDGLLADANCPANHIIYFMFQWLSFASLQQAASTVVDFRVVNFIRNAHGSGSLNLVYWWKYRFGQFCQLLFPKIRNNSSVQISFSSLQQASSTVVDFHVVNFIRHAHGSSSFNLVNW